MNPKSSRGPAKTRLFALVLACSVAALAVGQAAPQPRHQPRASLPLPGPSSLPLPSPIPGLETSLAPPELPKIPSLPQVLPFNAPPASGSTELPVTNATYDAKILVVSADGTEPVLGAIRQAADYIGIPYTLYVASRTPGGFTPAMLSDGGSHAFYQGIVLTTGSLAYFDGTAWTSAFTLAEWQTLWDYQAKYRVRTALGYVFPTADYGYGPATGVDTSVTPIAATLTSAGQSVFPYVTTSNPIPIANAWTYLASAAGADTTVLLTDAAAHALSLVRNYPDGRQVLSMTFDGNFFLIHSLTLSYGLLNWVTGGLFLGERHIYMTPQVDDVFIDDDVYPSGTYRITGTDWTAVAGWQTAKKWQPVTANLQLHMAFNGEGAKFGQYFPDTLTPTAMVTQSQFPWINHTYDHENLDNVSYGVAYQEITKNNDAAASMGLANYDRRALVTPDISGLSNPNSMNAAYDAGVRFVVSDTSRPGMDNPTPQTGIPNWEEPRILMIPRRPVNLFYNVTTPSEWTAEYNTLYRAYWGRDLTYAEILDKVSDVTLQYVLRGEVDPWMFHQSNLRAYDGVHTLLGDFLDRTLDKYGRLFVLPVGSPTQVALGDFMLNRMAYNSAGVVASFVPDQNTITLSTTSPVVVPVTGLCTASSEVYGGQCITHVSLGAGESVTLDLR